MALPDPITRKEMYLNKAATGEGNVPPEPVTREEMYLAEIANGGGGGSQEPLALQAASTATPPFIGTVSGATKQEILDAWNAGRRVSVYLMGNEVVLTVASQLGSNNPILAGYFMYQSDDNTVLFCRAFTRVSDMAYWVTPFTGLTAIT